MDERETQTKDLERRIKALHAEVTGVQPQKSDTQGAGVAMMILSDLIGGLVAGGAVGFLIQQFFNTKPFIWALFIFLGGIAGLVNVYKYVRRLEKEQKP